MDAVFRRVFALADSGIVCTMQWRDLFSTAEAEMSHGEMECGVSRSRMAVIEHGGEGSFVPRVRRHVIPPALY